MWRLRRRCGDLAVAGDLRPATGAPVVLHHELVTIPVDRIIGTVDRCCDFDRCFRVLRRHLEARLEQVRRRWPTGAFPPIQVERIGDDYFVVDGHHRVALARQLGQRAVEAKVTTAVDVVCCSH